MATKNTFEGNVEQLEEIISKLEQGGTTLDESVFLFENGIKLTDECLKMLDKAEQKVKMLTENKDETAVESDFILSE